MKFQEIVHRVNGVSGIAAASFGSDVEDDLSQTLPTPDRGRD
ncbi:hypothetical protein [Yimella lutea]|nr:hypothetical protein [Yimella lutea]